MIAGTSSVTCHECGDAPTISCPRMVASWNSAVPSRLIRHPDTPVRKLSDWIAFRTRVVPATIGLPNGIRSHYRRLAGQVLIALDGQRRPRAHVRACPSGFVRVVCPDQAFRVGTVQRAGVRALYEHAVNVDLGGGYERVRAGRSGGHGDEPVPPGRHQRGPRRAVRSDDIGRGTPERLTGRAHHHVTGRRIAGVVPPRPSHASYRHTQAPTKNATPSASAVLLRRKIGRDISRTSVRRLAAPWPVYIQASACLHQMWI